MVVMLVIVVVIFDVTGMRVGGDAAVIVVAVGFPAKTAIHNCLLNSVFEAFKRKIIANIGF